jgi:hypothetical protein
MEVQATHASRKKPVINAENKDRRDHAQFVHSSDITMLQKNEFGQHRSENIPLTPIF